ncbi:EF-P lysine aminoacylase EpmA [Gilvimarinus sp. SDUM040013]|uniref:EF-P lysine aminoacylase EpmA n=1 Tax=Gilvimarinus gilvus TaxID=3058038 RepID=A0ABU4RTQ3_9GAMM|nr:EF-P lysine aminoacylase EpmA [Gilvimarinus sp. SDUM040013]MDO3386804.1 EF-P lysine aminoacylase EpmA [Gilvimarinus sp. SDUM040013]MDX6848266.1 EF-P lysine aminoacylase EpmA [Gilvimarinus sp. SDUM040013]
MSDHHLPTSTPAALEARAALYQLIRHFFASRHVLEVELPLLCQHFVTDPFIQPVVAERNGRQAYLQSSPEYAMKRLLAQMPRCIYSLGKAFRDGESSRRHNCEFTMLEWYRVELDDRALMAEVAELVKAVVPDLAVNYLSYRDWFFNELGVDPHCATREELQTLGAQWIEINPDGLSKDDWLDLLITHRLESRLPQGLTFIYDYPVSQAALARIAPDATGQPVARRFEAFLNGMELANGYWELTDATELALRFTADQRRREELGLPYIAADERLLAAMKDGLPNCAGVALGVDRLLMQSLGLEHIQQVLTFSTARA